jgi:hypothetical protein
MGKQCYQLHWNVADEQGLEINLFMIWQAAIKMLYSIHSILLAYFYNKVQIIFLEIAFFEFRKNYVYNICGIHLRL